MWMLPYAFVILVSVSLRLNSVIYNSLQDLKHSQFEMSHSLKNQMVFDNIVNVISPT